MAENKIDFDPATDEFVCKGAWDIANIPQLNALVKGLSLPKSNSVTINGKGISKLDSAGAWFLYEWKKRLEAKGKTVNFVQFSPHAQTLMELVGLKIQSEKAIPETKIPAWVTQVGMMNVEQFFEFIDYLNFIGILTYDFFRIMTSATRSRIISYATVIYQTGYQALFIIAVLSFMIGVVIAYQLGIQLRDYGADIYIVDLLGLSILREFGPLITAIMVSGRTGSSFTAQIGMMRLNQEIDALNTMGVTASEVLIIPRIIGLFIVLPLLTMWSNIFAVIGGMVMTNYMLNISPYDFLARFPTVIPLKTIFIGLGKTPTFALIIATVGCFQGLRVRGGAASLGKNTTRSVVLAIFFILVADAIFSVIFSKLDL